MRRLAFPLALALGIGLAGCSEPAPEPGDSMESQLAEAAKNSPQRGEWQPKDGGGKKADKDKLQAPEEKR